MGSPDFVHEIVIIETQTVPLTKYMMDIAGVRTCPEDAKQETLSLQHLCFISPNLWLDSLNSLAFLHFSPSPPTLQKMDQMALAAFMPSTADPFFLLKEEIYIGTIATKKQNTPTHPGGIMAFRREKKPQRILIISQSPSVQGEALGRVGAKFGRGKGLQRSQGTSDWVTWNLKGDGSKMAGWVVVSWLWLVGCGSWLWKLKLKWLVFLCFLFFLCFGRHPFD